MIINIVIRLIKRRVHNLEYIIFAISHLSHDYIFLILFYSTHLLLRGVILEGNFIFSNSFITYFIFFVIILCIWCFCLFILVFQMCNFPFFNYFFSCSLLIFQLNLFKILFILIFEIIYNLTTTSHKLIIL